MDYQQGTPIKIIDNFSVGGTATNPTNLSYKILAPDGTITTYSWPGAPEIANPSVGSFVLSLGVPTGVGYYTYDVDATGAVFASRQGSFTVLANASSPDPDIDWAVPGPCQPWTSSQDVWNCCGQPTTTIDGVVCNVDFTAEAMAASQLLFELSGRRFSGACSKTVRPCSDRWCGFQVLSRGHIVWPDDWSVGWGGMAWNWNSRHGCGCQPLDRILLSGYPVREVTEVLIDGVVVDPDTYRLDERRYLTRVRATAADTMNFWPNCQALDLPDSQPGTFSVTYRYGMDPPLVGVDAAAELACELYKACNGAADCNLPSGITRITRQGVVIERMAFSAWGLQKNTAREAGIWKTGLTRVDAFLNAWNAPRMTRRPSTWSPDGLKFARPVGQ